MLLSVSPSIITVTLNPAIDRIVRVPGLTLGEHVRGTTIDRIPAGKGVNVSHALSALGVPSIATGFVGRRQLEAFEHSLDATTTPRFVTVSGDTRENITLVDPTVPTETHVRDEGFVVGRDDLERLREELAQLVGPDTILVIAGSLPIGLTGQDVAMLVDLVHAKGGRVAVDGPGELLRDLADCRLWLVTPNIRELMGVTAAGRTSVSVHMPPPTESHTITIGLALSRRIDIVMVTAGASGAYLFSKGQVLRGKVPTQRERVHSTVGCGDAFVGGFLAAKMQGEDDTGCFRRALGVAKASSFTDHPGRFDPDRADACADAATIEPCVPQSPTVPTRKSIPPKNRF